MKKDKKEKEEPIEDPVVEQNSEQDYVLPEDAQSEPVPSVKVDEFFLMAQRIQADFDNYRKRNANLRAEAMLDGKLEVIKAFLPIADSLGRAIDQEDCTEASGTLFEGLKLIFKQSTQLLEDLGVEEIIAMGQQFDPKYHHGVMQAPAEGEQKPGEVLEVFQKGYRLGDKVIRYTMVKVAI